MADLVKDKYSKIAFIAHLVMLFTIALGAQPVTPFRVVGYYSLKAAQNANPRQVPFKMLTHVNLWFLNPDTLGNFSQDLSGLKPFIDEAHRKKVRVLFSIAGGSPHPYYHALLSADRRAEFIGNLIAQTLKYDVDGIDVDIEGNDIDENYEIFVIELSAALRQYNKLITAAIAVYYKDQLTDRALSQYDFVNIMSYDRTGPWRPDHPGPHAELKDAEDDLAYFGEIRGIPKGKMTLGVPFYGYGFGPWLTSPAVSMNFGDIVNNYKGSETKDMWRTQTGQNIYYNGIPTIKQKTTLARKKASGIMIWQMLGDAHGNKSLLKAIYKSSKEKQ